MKNSLTTDIVPLVRAIATDNAVVFVGAGASMDAGLPSWKQFLEECLNRAETHRSDHDRLASVRERIVSGDFLIAAEILQNVLEADLPHLIRQRFAQSKLRPTDIHKAIAGINFPLALTTNYDRLLELAYPQPAQTLTWQNAEDILLAMREREFKVVKIHGDVSIQSSLVLTRTNYRKLMHLNEAFKVCIKTLLLTKTVLFVGCSLRDHDLLSLIDEARSEFDSGFGPHYALLLQSETDNYLSEALRDCYRINVITVDTDSGKRASSLSGLPLPNLPVSSVVADYLTEISGRVATERLNRERTTPAHKSLFSLRAVINNLLRRAATLCGAHRAELFLVEPGADSKKAIYRESMYSVHDGNTRFFEPSQLAGPETVQGRLFLQRKVERDYIYISDIDNHEHELKVQGYDGLKCSHSHNDSASLLACPVYSDGKRSGILSIESERKRAFSLGHLQVLEDVAREIGWAQFEARQRRNAARPLKRYADDMPTFVRLMNQSRLLASCQLRHILYDVDVFNGRVNGYYVDKEGKQCDRPFSYSFDEPSLAVDVLKNRQKIFFRDVDTALTNGDVSERGVAHFTIKGPIFGLPIHCHGTAAGILVCWSNSGIPKDAAEMTRFSQAIERTRRMAHLVANDPKAVAEARGVSVQGDVSAEAFIRVVNDRLFTVDQGRMWTRKEYLQSDFRQAILTGLLGSLLDPSCGLRRARLWILDGDGSFKCIHSVTREDSVAVGYDKTDAYANLLIPSSDPFGDYIRVRAIYDPYARVMDETMLGDHKELLSQELHKAQGAPWIIAPICRNTESGSSDQTLLGFIAADNHYWDSETKQPRCQSVSEDMMTYHRYCIDEITDIISSIMVFQRRALMGLQRRAQRRKQPRPTPALKRKRRR